MKLSLVRPLVLSPAYVPTSSKQLTFLPALYGSKQQITRARESPGYREGDSNLNPSRSSKQGFRSHSLNSLEI